MIAAGKISTSLCKEVFLDSLKNTTGLQRRSHLHKQAKIKALIVLFKVIYRFHNLFSCKLNKDICCEDVFFNKIAFF